MHLVTEGKKWGKYQAVNKIFNSDCNWNQNLMNSNKVKSDRHISQIFSLYEVLVKSFTEKYNCNELYIQIEDVWHGPLQLKQLIKHPRDWLEQYT